MDFDSCTDVERNFTFFSLSNDLLNCEHVRWTRIKEVFSKNDLWSKSLYKVNQRLLICLQTIIIDLYCFVLSLSISPVYKCLL